MRNAMGKILLLAMAVVAVSMLLGSRPALACIATIDGAEAYLEKSLKMAVNAKYKDKTAIRWLKETQKALADAKRDCDKEEAFFRRRLIATRVLGLRAKMVTAVTRIEFENYPSDSSKKQKGGEPEEKSKHLSGEP